MQNDEFRAGVIQPIEVYKEAWTVIKDQYWLLFAITLVGLLIGNLIPIILTGPMVCGLFLIFLKKIDGELPDFSVLFKGFDYLKPSILVSLVVFVPSIALFLIIYIPMVVMMLGGQRMSEDEVWAFLIGTLAVEFVVALVVVCLHTLILFAFPLIVDRNLSGIKSITTSAKAVWANLGGVVGLFAIGFVAALAGYLALCIGIYLVLPLMVASTAVAFRKVFPKLSSSSSFPPPPPHFGQGF